MTTSGEEPNDREWFDEEPVRFECTLCGNCCTGPSGFILFSREEGENIARRLGVSYEQFYEQYTHDTPAGRSHGSSSRTARSSTTACSSIAIASPESWSARSTKTARPSAAHSPIGRSTWAHAGPGVCSPDRARASAGETSCRQARSASNARSRSRVASNAAICSRDPVSDPITS